MDIQKLEKMVKDVLGDFPSIKYGICESKKNSLYLYLKLYGISTSMMIDNREKKSKIHLKDTLENKNKTYNLKLSIKNLCISLQQKRTEILFSCLKFRRRQMLVS